jgi:hypothetical protein
MAENTEYIIIAVLGFVLALLAAAIIFLVSQQKVLQLIDPEHRRMRPGQVWLQLIPVYNYVWQFIVVARIADSIQAQLLAEDNDSIIGSAANVSDRPTYRSGIGYCVLTIISTCTSFIPLLASIYFLASVAMIIIWIIYWIELEKFKKVLKLRLAVGVTA